MLNIHPGAIRRFNQRAKEIAEIVAAETVGGANSNSTSAVPREVEFGHHGFCPDIHVKSSIGAKDIIGEPQIGKVDFLGNTVAYAFRRGRIEYWMEGRTYIEIIRLAESVQRCNTVRNLISKKTIEKSLCKWIEERVADGNLAEFIETLEGVAESIVEEIEIRAPISQMFVEESFEFGRLQIASTTREEIAAWEVMAIGKADEHKEKLSGHFAKKIRPMQGHAYASLKLRAEPRRAKEVVLEETERAVSILRMFSVTALHPQAVSGCVLWGQAQQDESCVLIISEGKLSKDLRALKGSHLVPLRLSKTELQECWVIGCSVYDRLLRSSKLTEFEKKILDAALLYSKCTVAKTVAEKFTFIFSALESVFIKNNTESIQSNLSERMAFALEDTAEKRKAIIGSVKSAYGLRSRFLHHGESVDNLQQAEEFMVFAWRAILWLTGVTAQFSRVEDMLAELERRKLS